MRCTFCNVFKVYLSTVKEKAQCLYGHTGICVSKFLQYFGFMMYDLWFIEYMIYDAWKPSSGACSSHE